MSTHHASVVDQAFFGPHPAEYVSLSIGLDNPCAREPTVENATMQQTRAPNGDPRLRTLETMVDAGPTQTLPVDLDELPGTYVVTCGTSDALLGRPERSQP